MAKRIRQVFPTANIAHLWASGDVELARNAQGNFSFRKIGNARVLFSYRAPIAWDGVAPNGERVRVLCSHRYSVTTSRHQMLARRAVWSLPGCVFYVDGLREAMGGYDGKIDPLPLLEAYDSERLACLEKAAVATTRREHYEEEAERIGAEAFELAGVFGVRWVARDFDVDAFLEARKARAREKATATRAHKARTAATVAACRAALAAELERMGPAALGLAAGDFRDVEPYDLAIDGTLRFGDAAGWARAKIAPALIERRIQIVADAALARPGVLEGMPADAAAMLERDAWLADAARDAAVRCTRGDALALRAVDAPADAAAVAADDVLAGRFLEHYRRELADRIARERVAQMTAAERIAAWRAGVALGAYTVRTADGGALLRVSRDGSTVETSQGASFPASHAARLWRAIQAARRTGGVAYDRADSSRPKAGHFTVDAIDGAGNVRAGCHRVSFEECERLALELGLIGNGESDAGAAGGEG